MAAVWASPAGAAPVTKRMTCFSFHWGSCCFSQLFPMTLPAWNQLHAFYLPGGLRYERMGTVDRAMMAVYRRMLRAKEGPDSLAYQTICRSFDMADRAAIRPIVDCCQAL